MKAFAEFFENEIDVLKKKKLEFLLSELYAKIVIELQEKLKAFERDGISLEVSCHRHYISNSEYSTIDAEIIRKYFVGRGWSCDVTKNPDSDRYSNYNTTVTIFFKKDKG